MSQKTFFISVMLLSMFLGKNSFLSGIEISSLKILKQIRIRDKKEKCHMGVGPEKGEKISRSTRMAQCNNKLVTLSN